MNFSLIIPARLASTRFPEKVLAPLGGKTVIQRVWEAASRAECACEVIIATDSEKVADHVRSFGAQVAMTAPECPNGTARIASILTRLKGDFILNVQGDEPFIQPALLDALAERARTSRCDLVTAVYRLHETTQLTNPNLVKVVRASDGRALYFSRSAIPYLRDADLAQWTTRHAYWGHIGVYGYSRQVLEAYPTLIPSPLESIECLEQLRFLDHGYTLQTVETDHCTPGIDTPEDLENALRFLQKAAQP